MSAAGIVGEQRHAARSQQNKSNSETPTD